MDSVSLQLFLQEIQLAITILVAGVDLFVVFRLIWFSMLREIPKSSGMTARDAFRFTGKALGRWAKEQQELENV
jgi:hypothetical protein